MGFFKDLLKSSTNWTYQELLAFANVMGVMAGADGKIDDKEWEIIDRAIIHKDKKDLISNLDDFISESSKMPPESSAKILRAMHTKKKEFVMAALAGVAIADGKGDEKEMEFYRGMEQILQVTLNK